MRINMIWHNDEWVNMFDTAEKYIASANCQDKLARRMCTEADLKKSFDTVKKQYGKVINSGVQSQVPKDKPTGSGKGSGTGKK